MNEMEIGYKSRRNDKYRWIYVLFKYQFKFEPAHWKSNYF